VKGAIPLKIAVSVVFVSSMFMNIMDSTVVNVALPTLSRSFGVPLASVSGVVTAYLVTLAVAMPASGWLGDRFGAKAVMIASVGLFTLASALCGLATSLPELIVFRALQGIGSGLFVPVGMAMLFRTFPPAERIRANRYLMVPTLVAPASGPVIGGALVTGLTWRWIFYINVPIGVAALAFGLLCLPGGSEHPAGRFDLPGFLLAAAGFPLFMYALSTGATSGWASPSVAGTGMIGLLLLIAFLTVERRVAEPMLRLRIFSDRLFRITNLQLTVASAGFMGTLFLAPLLLQNGLLLLQHDALLRFLLQYPLLIVLILLLLQEAQLLLTGDLLLLLCKLQLPLPLQFLHVWLLLYGRACTTPPVLLCSLLLGGLLRGLLGSLLLRGLLLGNLLLGGLLDGLLGSLLLGGLLRSLLGSQLLCGLVAFCLILVALFLVLPFLVVLAVTLSLVFLLLPLLREYACRGGEYQ